MPPIAPDRQRWTFVVPQTDRTDDGRGGAAHEGQGRQDGRLHRLLRQLGRPGLQRAHRAGADLWLQGRHQRTLRARRHQRHRAGAEGDGSAAPDAVVVGGSGSPAATPQIALVEQGYKGPIYHNHGTVNKAFIQTAKKAAEGAIAPTGALIVAEELPADFATKAVSLDFVKRYEAAFGAGSRNAFAGYTYDGVLLLDAAAAVALKKAKPGTAEFREALRDALENLKNIIGTHGVYNMTPANHNGLDERARVLVKVSEGEWRLLK